MQTLGTRFGVEFEAPTKTVTLDTLDTLAHFRHFLHSKVHMADWNGDGLNDLLVGHNDTIIIYKNTGTESAPSFQAPTLIKPSKGDFPPRPSPYVVDWDGDGKRDLLVGSDDPKVYFYRNIGTDMTPKLDKGKELNLRIRSAYRYRIDVADWNNDGKKDILVGNIYNRKKGVNPPAGGNIWLFLGK